MSSPDLDRCHVRKIKVAWMKSWLELDRHAQINNRTNCCNHVFQSSCPSRVDSRVRGHLVTDGSGNGLHDMKTAEIRVLFPYCLINLPHTMRFITMATELTKWCHCGTIVWTLSTKITFDKHSTNKSTTLGLFQPPDTNIVGFTALSLFFLTTVSISGSREVAGACPSCMDEGRVHPELVVSSLQGPAWAFGGGFGFYCSSCYLGEQTRTPGAVCLAVCYCSYKPQVVVNEYY